MRQPSGMPGTIKTIISFLLLFLTGSSLHAGGKLLPAEMSVYETCGLSGKVCEEAFAKAYRNFARVPSSSGKIAIIDFTLPSSQQRLFIIDLNTNTLLYSSLVAHGRATGDLMARNFSNTPESHMSSPGLYKIGDKIVSPKHGDALLLEGLDKGVNDNARRREIIIHAADYVSSDFIRKYGRIGRSHGCPAVSRQDIGTVINLLQNGGLLYIYTGPQS
jgi:hypothetical protein